MARGHQKRCSSGSRQAARNCAKDSSSYSDPAQSTVMRDAPIGSISNAALRVQAFPSFTIPGIYRSIFCRASTQRSTAALSPASGSCWWKLLIRWLTVAVTCAGSIENGEKHIADVKTDQGWVLEFQHSHLDPDERRARDAFYPKLVWVVDGARRKRDQSQFFRAFEQGTPVPVNVPLRRVFSDECALLREWCGSRAPVFLDFGEAVRLWCLLPGNPNGKAYVGPFARARFIELHLARTTQTGQDFAGLLKTLSEIVSIDLSGRIALSRNQFVQPPPNGFRQYVAQRVRSRRRF